MKYGLHLAGGASVCNRKVLMDVARIAEEEGCDSLLIGDHIVLPKSIASPWPYEEYNDGKPNYDIYTSMEWLDPFDTIAFVAGITDRMRLGLSVLIVPYRHPFDVARRVATIDVLSGGRFILGTGVGWLEEEFNLLGVPFQRRGKRTREYIEMMKALWTEDSPRYDGRVRHPGRRRQRAPASPAETPPAHLGWRRIGLRPETGRPVWRRLAYCPADL